MGIFWDKLKGIFTKKAILAEETPQYERDERVVYTDMADFFDAIDEHAKHGGSMIFKQSTGKDLELLKTTSVGFGREYDNKLAIRKTKSQQRNWKKWREKR